MMLKIERAVEAFLKLFFTCLVLLLAGCGVVTKQSIYEGLRTQQNLKDAGTQQPSEKLGGYSAYEKDRERLKQPD